MTAAAARAASIEGVQARMARTNLQQADVERQYKDELRWMQKVRTVARGVWEARGLGWEG